VFSLRLVFIKQSNSISLFFGSDPGASKSLERLTRQGRCQEQRAMLAQANALTRFAILFWLIVFRCA
jgi:hypothetical protein